MNALILSLTLSAFGDADAAVPTAMKLDDEARPRQEQDTQRPEDGRMGIMEHVYRYSELDGGLLWTFWDKDLDLENDIGWFVRYGVGLGDNLSLTLTYRHYDYDNTELPGGAEDHVILRSVLAGAAFRLPIGRDFEFVGHGSAGVMRWDSSGANLDDDMGPVISAEGALVVRLHEVLRFRFGAALDWARTEFHEDTEENVLSLTLLFGLEIGGR
jgi:hypothetical protein